SGAPSLGPGWQPGRALGVGLRQRSDRIVRMVRGADSHPLAHAGTGRAGDGGPDLRFAVQWRPRSGRPSRPPSPPALHLATRALGVPTRWLTPRPCGCGAPEPSGVTEYPEWEVVSLGPLYEWGPGSPRAGPLYG